MKLFTKSLLMLGGLCTLASTIGFSATSCSKTNPYESKSTGDAIQINNKTDANNCKTQALKFIDIFSQQTISSTPENLLSLLTNGGSDYVYASTQVYWELVYYMCDTYSSGMRSVSLENAQTLNGQCVFLANGSNNSLTLTTNSQIICNGFMTNWTGSGFKVYYAAPVTPAVHFTLNYTNDGTIITSFISRGLWSCVSGS